MINRDAVRLVADWKLRDAWQMTAKTINLQQARWLYRTGAALLLLGLVSGLVTTFVANPRMGLSAHLEGVLNGILLIALGSAWTAVALPRQLKRAAVLLLNVGSAINWLATQLSALWGTGALTPIIAPRPSALAAQEMIVSFMLGSVAVFMLLGMLLVAIGFCRAELD
jgi:hydroxylaminobenzene mutase